MLLLRRILRIVFFLFIVLNIIVAFHAYKFTHFYPENEISVKKPEEMNGWDKTKAILFGVNYAKSKNTLPTDTVFQTINFKTKDGLSIEAWYDTIKSALGTVILFHGHGASKSKVLTEANAFQSMGYNTLLVDFRAHGGSDGRVCTIGFEEAEEVKLAFDYIQQKGEKNTILWGISMGAAAITAAIHQYKISPTKIILEMPFGRLKDAVKGRLKVMGLPNEPFATLLTFWGGAEQGFWAFNYNPDDYSKDINCPVLLQWGKKDARVSEQETNSIFNKIGTKNKKLVIYENAKHESLCKHDNEKWRKEVGNFLKS